MQRSINESEIQSERGHVTRFTSHSGTDSGPVKQRSSDDGDAVAGLRELLDRGFEPMSGGTYDAYDADVNRRIEASETRIKNWVLVGIAANLLAGMGMGIPMVYYLGTLNAQTTQAIAQMNKSVEGAELMSKRLDRIEWRQRAVLQHLKQTEQFEPPETP